MKNKFSQFKTEIDKLDIDKLVSVPVDLSELNDVVKNDFDKKLYIINQLLKYIVLILADLF